MSTHVDAPRPAFPLEHDLLGFRDAPDSAYWDVGLVGHRVVDAAAGQDEGYSAGELDRCLGFEPSDAIVHSWSEPARVDANAIVVPSGDHAGDQSLP